MKRYLLLLLMLTATSAMFSQLKIQPNTITNTDSYMYVNDVVLYVGGGIILDPNTNADTKASIYLRGNAQLLQTGNTNGGDGLLSVFQTVLETSNFHYNFWNFPVSKPVGTANQNTGISVLYKPANTNNFNNTISTQAIPTTAYDGNDDPFTVSTRWIYTRPSSNILDIEADYDHIAGADDIPPGLGFTMKGVGLGPGSPPTPISFTYDFRGRPNTGFVSVPVVSSPTTIDTDDKGVLSGNPYPSALDLRKLFFGHNAIDTTKVITAIEFWDEPKDDEFSHYYVDKSGGYGTWIPGTEDNLGFYTAATFYKYYASGQSGGGVGNGVSYERRYAPIGQGFVIRTNFNADGYIYIKDDYRVYKPIGAESEFRNTEKSGNNTFAQPYEPTQEGDVSTLRINVNMRTPNSNHTRQLLLAFHEDSTDDFDLGLDAPHPSDINASDVSFPVTNGEYISSCVIQTVPFLTTKRIPLSIVITDASDLRVRVVEKVNFDYDAYLYDSLDGTTQNITNNYVVNYGAHLYLEEGVYEDRFFIVFKEKKREEELSVKEKVINAINFYQNNPQKQLEISNPEGYTISSALVYDMAGKLVVQKSNLGNAANITLSTSNLADGVYLIKLLTSDNINIDYKMVIVNR